LNLDPGTYSVTGAVSPERRDERQAVLAAGKNVTVVLDLSAPPPNVPAPHESEREQDIAAPSHRELSPFFYVAGAVGVVGLGTGIVTGLMADSKYSEAEEACPEFGCVPGTSGPGAVNSFRRLRLASTISYGVGAAGVVAGVVLFLTADTSPEGTEEASIEPWLTTDTAGIRARF
jgi:hypothetical protein